MWQYHCVCKQLISILQHLVILYIRQIQASIGGDFFGPDCHLLFHQYYIDSDTFFLSWPIRAFDSLLIKPFQFI